MKREKKCTDCGKLLTKEDDKLTCNNCNTKRKLSQMETRLHRLEKAIDNILQLQEKNMKEDIKNDTFK
jgi:DNA-directed RNA polymerase subunit RPC12/RpoP